jgi:hypothetical protein
MLSCLPYLAFVGFGLNFLLSAVSPSWRGKDQQQWKLYNLVNFLPAFLESFLGQIGFSRSGFIRPTPIARIDSEKSAIALYFVFAATFLFLGIGGLVMVVYNSMA